MVLQCILYLINISHMRYSRSSSKHLLISSLRYSRDDKYTIICYPQSTDPLPCGTPPDSGGEFLVCICYLYSVISTLLLIKPIKPIENTTSFKNFYTTNGSTFAAEGCESQKTRQKHIIIWNLYQHF